ncbi:hypothetical protein BH10PSE1_BH10PSE1_28200 [soil metagenome]
MTTEPVTEAERADIATAADTAFEAMYFDMSSIPALSYFSNPGLPTIRLAAVMLTKTKEQLVQVVKDLEPEHFDDLLANLGNAVAIFGGLNDMCVSAEARMMIALAVATQDTL